MIETYKLTGTTNGSGAATITNAAAAFGLLYAVEWIDGDLADSHTAVLSVTSTDSGVDQVLLTLGAGEGDNDKWYYPLAGAHDPAATVATYDGTYPVGVKAVVNGSLKLVIASGGATTTGGCIVYLLEDR